MGPFVRRALLLSLFAAFPLTAHAQSGRLTLEQHNPLPTAADTSTETSATVWWEPYNGASLTILDASGQPHSYQPGELSVPIATYVAGDTLGVYIFLNSANVPVLGVSLWPSPTRELVPSFWQGGVKVNSASITLTTSAGSQTVGESQATRVGIVYLPVDSETGIQIKLPPAPGGTSPTIGYCNDYNREPLSVTEQDSNASWQVLGPWGHMQMVDGSAQNRIYFVSCDEGIQHEVRAKTTMAVFPTGSSLPVAYAMLIAVDDACSNNTPPTPFPGQVWEIGGTAGEQAIPVDVDATIKGLQGLHYVQACETGSPNPPPPATPLASPSANGSGSGPSDTDLQNAGGNYGLILNTKF